MNVKLKIEVLKVFLLEFELNSEKKEEEEIAEEEPTKPHPGGIQ